MKAFGLLLCICLVGSGVLPGTQGAVWAQGPALDVLHWWTSASERRAADRLSAQLAQAGVQWNDMAVPGGGGSAAVKVLRSRVLMGDPPDVAQLLGSNLTDWAGRSMLLPLNAVAARQGWAQSLFPFVMEGITFKGDVIAVPVGVHRINTLLYNRRLLAKLGLQPPRTWTEFEQVARALLAAGIKPLAWSDEAWQIATVFESLLLAEAGPAAYREMVVQRKPAPWLLGPVQQALQRLRWLRGLNNDTPLERPWTTSARDVRDGMAAMMIMGDWAYGELRAWGADPEADVGCVPVPGTAGMHLYSVDSLAMLVNARHRVALQEKLAEVVVGMPGQRDFNQAKGSVPVRKDLNTAVLQSMDACARDSWETLASPSASRVPSLAHRMAADEAAKDAVALTLWRYLSDPQSTVQGAQRRLASVIRAP